MLMLSVVQGIFKQSDPGFVDGGYDLLGDSFGLIDQEGDRWGKFQRCVYFSLFSFSSSSPSRLSLSPEGGADDRHIERLNTEADDGTTYKVLWVARHGQGVHNVVCPSPPSSIYSSSVHS